MFKKIITYLKEKKPKINLYALLSFFVMAILAIISIYLNIREATVMGEVTFYKSNGIISYGGKLINDSAIHANGLTMKSIFSNGEVLDVDIDTADHIEYSNFGKPPDFAEFCLNRLSRQKQCNFTILVRPNGDISEKINVAWGKNGTLDLKPLSADDETVRHIKRGISIADISKKARNAWISRNTKKVR
jgi:hypothetical protein